MVQRSHIKCRKPLILLHFYLSILLSVGNNSALNSALSILLQILSFAGFPVIHNSSYHIRKNANLLSNCCHRRGFVVSLITPKPFLKDIQFRQPIKRLLLFVIRSFSIYVHRCFNVPMSHNCLNHFQVCFIFA